METFKPNVKIVCNGEPYNTKVFVDDKEINSVVSIKWEFNTNMDFPIATIKCFANDFNVVADGSIINKEGEKVK